MTTTASQHPDGHDAQVGPLDEDRQDRRDGYVAEGDTLAKGDDVLDIDTDKIAGTLESSVGGLIRRLVVGVGDELPVGAVLAVVAPAEVPDAEIEAVVEAARAAAESGDARRDGRAAAAARRDRRPDHLVPHAGARRSPCDAPVVLVHGFGGDKNSWLFVQQPLAEERAVHALDLPGHGASAQGRRRRVAGERSPTSSSGSSTRSGSTGRTSSGTPWAGRSSRRGAAGAGQGGVADAARPGRATAPEADAEYLRGFAAAVSRRELKPLLGRLFADPVLVTRQLVDDLLRYKRLDGVDKALSALLGTLLDGDRQAIDTPALLAGVDVPVTVMWGSADGILPPPEGTGERVAAGHMLHMEAANDVVRVLRERVAG